MRLLLALLLTLLVAAPASAQFLAADRTSGTKVLDALNETHDVAAFGYQSFLVSFTANTSFIGTVKPVCAFDAAGTLTESTDFKLIQISDDVDAPGANASLVDADVNKTFVIFCGPKSPRRAGVKATAFTSGSVTAEVFAVQNLRFVFLLTSKGVDPGGASGIKTEEQNKAESAGKSGAASIDSFTHCTGQFNELLDANENVHLTPLPSAGEFSRICWLVAVIDADATGTANFSLVNGTTTTTPCDTSADTITPTFTFNATKGTPGLYLGGFNGPILAIAAAERICAKSTNATAVNKILIFGKYATY